MRLSYKIFEQFQYRNSLVKDITKLNMNTKCISNMLIQSE